VKQLACIALLVTAITTAAYAGVNKVAMGALQKSYSVYEDDIINTNSTTFVDIPGARVVDNVGGSAKVAYHVTFSGACSIDATGSPNEVQVMIRARINGTDLGPSTAQILCEDFDNGTGTPTFAASVQWAVKDIPPGRNVIKLQWAAEGGFVGVLDLYHLTVRRHANN
jgi:hypothetical protein